MKTLNLRWKLHLFKFILGNLDPLGVIRNWRYSKVYTTAENFLTDLKTKLESSKNPEKAFSEAAVKYSSCPSGQRGGDLGSFIQGAMVPAFDTYVFSDGEVGKISPPIATPFGYHLIFLNEREE